MVIALLVVYAYTVAIDWASDVSHDPDFLDHVRIGGPVTLDYIHRFLSSRPYPPFQHCGPPPALKLFSHQKALPPPSLLSSFPSSPQPSQPTPIPQTYSNTKTFPPLRPPPPNRNARRRYQSENGENDTTGTAKNDSSKEFAKSGFRRSV